MNRILVASLASLAAVAPLARSANIPLEEATVTRIINDVRILDPKIGSGPAKVSQVIKDDMGIKTGVKSRAELLFQDNTLTRLGAESYFTFRPGTREMSLDSGTMLLQVPKDHGGATIRSASVTASITGTTIMLESIPRKSVKVLVLEGSLRLSLNNRIGESVSLRAGSMLMLRPGDKKLPEPVTVDLRRLIKTSSLVNPELFSAKNKPQPLPSMPLIAEAIAMQDKARAKGRLQDTNLVILGKGTKIVTADTQTLKRLDESDTDWTAGQTESKGIGTNSGGNARDTVAAAVVEKEAASANKGSGKVASIGTANGPYTKDVEVKSPVDLSTGTTRPGSGPSGFGGLFSIFTTGKVKINTQVEVSSNSPTRMSSTGGSIHIESLKTNDTGIEISNSSQLLSLLNSAAPGPGGRIEFVTAGGKIQLGGNVQADRGTITIDNNGPAGTIQIENATLAANVIKVGAVQPDGILTIGKSRLTADSLLQLYGGSGTGGVYFKDNTLLDGASLKYIAGKEVKIEGGKIVAIGGGPATVFADKASYSTASGGDGSTSGRFERQTAPGVAHAPTLLPYAGRP